MTASMIYPSQYGRQTAAACPPTRQSAGQRGHRPARGRSQDATECEGAGPGELSSVRPGLSILGPALQHMSVTTICSRPSVSNSGNWRTARNESLKSPRPESSWYSTIWGSDQATCRSRNESSAILVPSPAALPTALRSGIVNDPSRPDDPQYILRLIAKVLSVSLETVKIVERLPELGIEKAESVVDA